MNSHSQPPWSRGGLFLVSDAESAVVSDTRLAANLACFRWLDRHNRILEKKGRQEVSTYLSSLRPRPSDGRLGGVRRAADTLVGIAGSQGTFTAFALDADTPALLRKGAMEDSFTLHRRRVAIPLRVSRMGRRIVSVLDFGKDASRKVRCHAVSASYLKWISTNQRPNLPNGGLHSTDKYQCETPRTSTARRAVTMGGALDGCFSDPGKIALKLNGGGVHWPVRRLRRVSLGPDRANVQLLT